MNRLEELAFAIQSEMADNEDVDLIEFHYEFERMEYQLEMVRESINDLMRIFGVDDTQD